MEKQKKWRAKGQQTYIQNCVICLLCKLTECPLETAQYCPQQKIFLTYQLQIYFFLFVYILNSQKPCSAKCITRQGIMKTGKNFCHQRTFCHDIYPSIYIFTFSYLAVWNNAFLPCLFLPFQFIHLHFSETSPDFLLLAVANTWFLCRPPE